MDPFTVVDPMLVRENGHEILVVGSGSEHFYNWRQYIAAFPQLNIQGSR